MHVGQHTTDQDHGAPFAIGPARCVGASMRASFLEEKTISSPACDKCKRLALHTDDVSALVLERVGRTNGKISAKRLLPAVRTAGYAGSARNFRRLVASVKLEWHRGHRRGRRPAVWTPGTRWSSIGVSRTGCTCLCGPGVVAVPIRTVRRR
jgi:hypothetical protein